MKTKLNCSFIAPTLLALAILNLQFPTAFAQGVLTPPGAPAPTMKTLDQVEPRTPISSVPCVITNPGSYYLVSNLDLTVNIDAITIVTNGVTLDLKGFTIYTTFPSGTANGIVLNGGNSDITILNGHILGSNTAGPVGGSFPSIAGGITFIGASPANVHVADVSVTDCASSGINLGTNNSSTLVEDCTVQLVSGYGIEAAFISRSTASQCGSAAIIANNTADDCIGISLNGDGVDTKIANNCYGSAGNNGWGIYAANTANNSYGYVGNGSGIGFSAGIFAEIANNCYGASGGVGNGMFTYIANNCFCQSSDGNGLDTILAFDCIGNGGGPGVGIFATIANACSSNTGDTYITFHYNMP
jgi:hypothetical protein